ncbi:hypothetical protein GH714_002595 [Hevea brasiliensis]|uniref:Uncharacterized protein n=1 Tax=Hevea brasiliensis TaxID=3981 RepID=A0A6A6LFB5_HEVBR|nr:hypothetical protein GH714_002595 [Hevea brasiliensis]
MTNEQLVEFALGLANSNKTFMWVIRPDLVAGHTAVLPPEFVTVTKEREQQTNCRYICSEWGIGMEINSDVKRNEVESLLIELMEGDKGKEMKKKAMEWRQMAKEATASLGGSSVQNLENVINQALLSSSTD